MVHPLDRAIASDLSLQVLERIRRESQQASPVAHQADGRIQAARALPVRREAVPGDRPAIVDHFQGGFSVGAFVGKR